MFRIRTCLYWRLVFGGGTLGRRAFDTALEFENRRVGRLPNACVESCTPTCSGGVLLGVNSWRVDLGIAKARDQTPILAKHEIWCAVPVL